eukprot:1245896-Prorocentrum_lima.AAC.1
MIPKYPSTLSVRMCARMLVYQRHHRCPANSYARRAVVPCKVPLVEDHIYSNAPMAVASAH